MGGLRVHGARGRDAAFIFFLSLVAVGLFWLFRHVAVDDAYITYRFAQNLAQGQGFVYNPGEPVLSTTAPLYALVLAALGFLWPDLPRLSLVVSMGSLWGAAIFLYFLCLHSGDTLAGRVAALLLLLSPPLLANLGMETAFLLFLLTAGLLLISKERLAWAALAFAAAFLTRPDSLLLAALALGAVMWQQRRVPLLPLGVFALVVVPILGYLAVAFGSPAPATLEAKIAQGGLGLPASYLAELGSWFLRYYSLPWLAVAGLVGGIGVPFGVRHCPWLPALLLWAALQTVAYQLLGIAFYDWYPAPVALVMAVLVGYGCQVVVARLKSLVASPKGSIGGWLQASVPALLVVGQFLSALAVAVTLPTGRILLYEDVGHWLAANTPRSTTVAVMEVGVMGYYAQRPMIDFLGLLQPATVAALRRRDLLWSLTHYQPDYVVLTSVNAFYTTRLESLDPDHWFLYAYAPVKRFARPGFFGSPATIYQRMVAPTTQWEVDQPREVTFGDRMQLLRYRLDKGAPLAGDYLRLALVWRGLQAMAEDYAIFVHLLDERGERLTQGDLPGGTRGWRSGEVVETDHYLKLPAQATPGPYTLLVGVYHPQQQRRLALRDPEGGQSGETLTLHRLEIRGRQSGSGDLREGR